MTGVIYYACTSTPQCHKLNLHAKFEMSSFTHCKDMIWVKNLKWVT